MVARDPWKTQQAQEGEAAAGKAKQSSEINDKAVVEQYQGSWWFSRPVRYHTFEPTEAKEQQVDCYDCSKTTRQHNKHSFIPFQARLPEEGRWVSDALLATSIEVE